MRGEQSPFKLLMINSLLFLITDMNYKLTYKTAITYEGDAEETIETHSTICDSLEKAETIKWQFSEGDFGDLTCFAFRIEPTTEHPS
jgi:hypothetical protein